MQEATVDNSKTAGHISAAAASCLSSDSYNCFSPSQFRVHFCLYQHPFHLLQQHHNWQLHRLRLSISRRRVLPAQPEDATAGKYRCSSPALSAGSESSQTLLAESPEIRSQTGLLLTQRHMLMRTHQKGKSLPKSAVPSLLMKNQLHRHRTCCH